ncbi:hypothetical protein BDF14DRAFT_738525 [Spinellus fusiger]|nr:hypothetical protein BDF14DRAFT_738525 [Spinellus fusiger]
MCLLGAIILLEERFCEESHQSGLSKWVEKVCAIETRGFETTMHSLDQFVKERVEIDRNRKKEKKTPSPILPIHAPPEIESLILPAKLSPVLPEKSLLNTNVTLINTKPLVPQEALQNEQNMLHLPIKETGTKIKPIEIEDSPLTDNLTLPETTSLIFDSDDTPSLIDSDTGQFFAEALSAKIEPDTKEYFGIDPLENRDTSSLIVSKSNDVIEKKDREPWVEGSLVDTNHSSINESMYLPSTLSRNCKQYDLSPSVYTNIVKQDTHQAIVYDHQERNPPTFTTPKTLIQSVSSSSDSLNIHSTLTSQPQLQPLLSSDPAFLFNSEQHSISCRWHDRILFSNVKDVYEVRTRVTQLEYFLSMDFCLSMKNTHRKSSCYVFELNFPTTWTHGSIKETLFNANEKEDECLVDGLLYRKFRSKCCDKAIGAMIIDALDNSLHSHKQLVGKLWFLRNAVFFKGFVP